MLRLLALSPRLERSAENGAEGSAESAELYCAIVIGGTNILGGRDRYLGTLVGVVVLLTSVLSTMEMPEAGQSRGVSRFR